MIKHPRPAEANWEQAHCLTPQIGLAARLDELGSTVAQPVGMDLAATMDLENKMYS